MSDEFRRRLIRLAHENPQVRSHLLPAITAGTPTRAAMIRLAHDNPSLRPVLIPLLKQGCIEGPTMARFEEGKPADPTQHMAPEDAERWREEHAKHRDKFKQACGPTCDCGEGSTMARFEEGKPADPTQHMAPEDAQRWREEHAKHRDKFKQAQSLRGVKTKSRIRLKNGDVILPGSTVTAVVFAKTRPSLAMVSIAGQAQPLKIQAKNLYSYLSGFEMPPSRAELARMLEKGEATTPTGARTKPDAWATDGSPSWLIVLGYV